MNYKEIVNKVSEELTLSNDVVDFAYKSYWEFIKNTLKSLDLNSINTEEEFNKLRTNFNVPSLGKLVCTYERFKGVRKHSEYIKKLKEYVKVKES